MQRYKRIYDLGFGSCDLGVETWDLLITVHRDNGYNFKQHIALPISITHVEVCDARNAQ
jgi:hypothetical protein